MAAQATYDDATLLLRLYELRREEKLRKARDWFATSFNAKSFEEFDKLCPQGSDNNAYFRMVVSYWEMAASFVARGVLHPELFFENSGELLMVWEKARDLLAQARVAMKNPMVGKNTEEVANAFIKWMNENSPEAYPAFQAAVKTMSATQQNPEG